MAKVETLYAQGYSLADFLVQRGGKAAFLKLLGETAVARRSGNDLDWDYPAAKWESALDRHFGLSVKDLERGWHGWVMAGCPTLPRGDKPGRGLPPGTLLADASGSMTGNRPARPVRTASAAPTRTDEVVRGQTPDRPAEPTRRDIPAKRAPAPVAVDGDAPQPRPAPLDSRVSYAEMLGDS